VAGGWSSVHLVGVYLADMSDFAAVNRVYSKRLPMRCPAARLCVGVSLGEGVRVGIECAASPLEHETLHVQSISRLVVLSVVESSSLFCRAVRG